MSKLSDLIAGVLSVDPDAEAMEFDGRWATWRDLDVQAAALSAILDEWGLGGGARVGVLIRNRPEMVPVMLALLMTGRCLATLNAVGPDEKLAAEIVSAATPVMIATASDWARPGLLAAATSIGALAVEVGPGETRVIQAADRALWTRPVAEGVAIEMLTSGTTGTPKRIPLPTRNLEKALLGAVAFEKGRHADDPPKLRAGVQIVSAPLAHIAGITGVMNSILAGRKFAFLERFTVEAFRSAVVRHRPKVAGAPPSALRMIMDAGVPPEDLSSLAAFRTGTAPLDPDLADAFYERYGIPVLQNYGATEFAGGVAGWTLDDFKRLWKAKRGSVGRLNPGVEAHVVDPDTGAELPLGAEGLLELRAPNVGDGKTWVRTTDLSVVDEDGFLFIRGRHDGAIIRGGFKILPDDVVTVIQQHPAVREASVLGIPDPRLGQVPVAAYVVKRDAQAPTDEELRAFLKERLMPYQIPVRFKVLEDMPRTPSMKVSLPGIRALFEAA